MQCFKMRAESSFKKSARVLGITEADTLTEQMVSTLDHVGGKDRDAFQEIVGTNKLKQNEQSCYFLLTQAWTDHRACNREDPG